MQDQLAVIRDLLKSILEHVCDLVEVWTPGQGIADDLTIEEIHDGGKIQFLPQQFELGDVGCPFQVGFFSLEITLQEVGSNLPHLAPIGAILLFS